jgi:hypothetical protein
MNNAKPSHCRRGSEDHRAIDGCDHMRAQRLRHGTNWRRSVWVIQLRTHPKPHPPQVATAITASNPRQAKKQTKTADINSHNARQA